MMDTAVRHSPVHDALARLNPEWGQLNSMPVALGFRDSEKEAALKERAGLCDLSALRRFGVRGRNAFEWLRERGLEVPDRANSWTKQPDGGLIIRLGTSEFLMEDAPESGTTGELEDALGSGAEGVYPVLRQDAAFALTGSHAGEVMLQTCGINFDAADSGERPVFLTRVAVISALVLPQTEEWSSVFRIWCSYPYGSYLWEELAKIVEEFGGGIVGFSALFEKPPD